MFSIFSDSDNLVMFFLVNVVALNCKCKKYVSFGCLLSFTFIDLTILI